MNYLVSSVNHYVKCAINDVFQIVDVLCATLRKCLEIWHQLLHVGFYIAKVVPDFVCLFLDRVYCLSTYLDQNLICPKLLSATDDTPCFLLST